MYHHFGIGVIRTLINKELDFILDKLAKHETEIRNIKLILEMFKTLEYDYDNDGGTYL